ncbi:MAG: polysaccharide deacetylase family protein [Leptospirales bacterium]|nr:polysaccharide deacetylase family protein [Leptospirales bacterium]
MKAIITALLVIFPFFGLKAGNEGVRILAYHTFMGDKNIYSFSPEEFKKQCEDLKSEGFTFITFEDFKKGKFEGDKNILLTIDDGHKTVYEAYKQVMRPLGIKPLLAVYPGIIDKKSFALTWEQLKEMLDDGCTLASHGYYHNFCDEKAIKKNSKAVETEIIKSKAVLEEKLGVKIDVFVYPFGVYSPQTEIILKEAGYSFAMTIKMGIAKIGVNPNYELPRYIMTRNKITNISGLFAQPKKTDAAQIKKSGEKTTANIKTKKPDGKAAAKTEKKAIKKIDKKTTRKNVAVKQDDLKKSAETKSGFAEPSSDSPLYGKNDSPLPLRDSESGEGYAAGSVSASVSEPSVSSVYAENTQELVPLESHYGEESETNSAIFGRYAKNISASSDHTKIRSIRERVHSLIILIYDVNVSFANEIHTKIAKIGSRIHGFFSNLKIFGN